jgi:hypothetical protein
VRLEQSLVLNRYLHGLLGVRGFSDLKDILSSYKDGVGGDGQSHFFHALASQKTCLFRKSGFKSMTRVLWDTIRLSKARGGVVSPNGYQPISLRCRNIRSAWRYSERCKRTPSGSAIPYFPAAQASKSARVISPNLRPATFFGAD